MTSDKKIAANRQNAQLSTGPRSDAGKTRSSRNALRDGFYSKSLIILPGLEDEFQLLRTQLLDSFQPNGGVQDALFDEILLASWNLRRAAVAETQVYTSQSDLTLDPLIDDSNDKRLNRIRQFARHNQLARDKAIRMLSDVQTEIRSRLQAFPPQPGLPAMEQKPHSFSVLVRLHDVVRAMRRAEGFKSAPLEEKNEAKSQPSLDPETAALLRNLALGIASTSAPGANSPQFSPAEQSAN